MGEDGAVVFGQQSPLHPLLVVPAPLLGRRWAQDSSGGPSLDTGWSTCAGPGIDSDINKKVSSVGGADMERC